MADQKYKETYNQVKKEYNSKLKRSRAKNYKTKVKQSENKSKAVWEVVRDIKENKHMGQEGIQSDKDAKSVANDYNNFLISAVSKLLKHQQYETFLQKQMTNQYC
ncbi:hypothetical protein JTB14_016272 [Gonioctena quinquepunctata]|nr:hypothetical protein JTB14_016272 [Gonioctena quinquepunctata]